jgi:hypothetical protein
MIHTIPYITVVTVYLLSAVMCCYFKCLDSPPDNSNNSVHRSLIALPNGNAPYKHLDTVQHKVSDRNVKISEDRTELLLCLLQNHLSSVQIHLITKN